MQSPLMPVTIQDTLMSPLSNNQAIGTPLRVKMFQPEQTCLLSREQMIISQNLVYGRRVQMMRKEQGI
jgi:hypothetical protein